ncbi:hypothetical protein GPECTOR_214g439 [Gonium pectorale]|uniref:Uncharacterized protein n=1 Tax=Gonium pectorale TaxID=33097 RepID=A0A150FWV0_GONPE|nr:hypothetical protein GPECTOR_214g439 [Gonium pectorale]|eukprot:KXZ42057.1 hypothetical protein GPECTOR_214g439 [Gonium pectorale]
MLSEPEPVGVYSPLAADVGGPVRRIVAEPGVTVRVSGLKRVSLRRPLDLPRLPGQYLAETYAQGLLGEPEEGFESAPGIMYLASEGPATQSKDVNPAALARMWAWPMPHTDSSAWLPYETVLRSVLASHPFNMDSVIKRGIGLRLTKSTIQGVHLISFDMEVRARQPRPEELEDSPMEWNERPLEIWEAVVQVQPKASDGGSGAGSYVFVPLSVKRKHSYQNTMTLSRSAVLMALTGGRNTSQAASNGYDQLDLGIAANAP